MARCGNLFNPIELSLLMKRVMMVSSAFFLLVLIPVNLLAQDLDLGAMVQPVPWDNKMIDPNYHIIFGAHRGHACNMRVLLKRQNREEIKGNFKDHLKRGHGTII